MRLRLAIRMAAVASISLLAATKAPAFSYVRTPISQSLTEHEAVVVADVTASGQGKVKVQVTRTIKGMTPKSIELHDTWRPDTEWTYGPVRLVKGKSYLLMLRHDERGRFQLPTDFAATGVVQIESPADPELRAIEILFELSGENCRDEREQTLRDAWKKESDATKFQLLQDFFYTSTPDEATVPFLVEAVRIRDKESWLLQWSAFVIGRHKYQQTIPVLLGRLKDKDWASPHIAMALGKVGAKQAYEPIMELINDEKVENREHFIRAICYLKDKRSAPLLTGLLDSHHAGGRQLDFDWVEPLMHVLDIPNRKLQILTVEVLGDLGISATRSLPKIRQLQESLHDDAEFQRVAKSALQKIEHPQPSVFWP